MRWGIGMKERSWLIWAFWIVVGFGILNSVGCSPGFKIWKTRFVVAEDAEVWDDLPEAMHQMQITEGVPEETWNITVFLNPGWRGRPNEACRYEWLGNGDRIVARTTHGPATAHDCLPHEFAHRWHHMDMGPEVLTSTETHHGPEWKWRHETLRDAAKDTWLGRKHF